MKGSTDKRTGCFAFLLQAAADSQVDLGLFLKVAPDGNDAIPVYNSNLKYLTLHTQIQDHQPEAHELFTA